MLRKLLFLTLVSTVVVAPAAMPLASAVPPVREIEPGQGDVVVTGQCAFPVLAHIEGGEVMTTFLDATGTPVRQITVFPGNTLTLINMDTGTSVTIMGTGATYVRAESNGGVSVQITGHGPFSPNPLTGEPGIWYLSGRARATFDAEGNLTSAVVSGGLDDLCDQMAV